eukprot:12840213-Ditylum_brightwellii.AAC.1
MTPLIVPSTEDENASPIVTWGNVASTPLVVAQDMDAFEEEEKGPLFDVPNVTGRETVARMAEE